MRTLLSSYIQADLAEGQYLSGLNQTDIDCLLDQLGYKDLEEFSKSVLPKNIFTQEKLGLNDAMSEEEALKVLKKYQKKILSIDRLLAKAIMEQLLLRLFQEMFLKTLDGIPPIPPIKLRSLKAG